MDLGLTPNSQLHILQTLQTPADSKMNTATKAVFDTPNSNAFGYGEDILVKEKAYDI
jgi:hypothetical protein